MMDLCMTGCDIYELAIGFHDTTPDMRPRNPAQRHVESFKEVLESVQGTFGVDSENTWSHSGNMWSRHTNQGYCKLFIPYMSFRSCYWPVGARCLCGWGFHRYFLTPETEEEYNTIIAELQAKGRCVNVNHQKIFVVLVKYDVRYHSVLNLPNRSWISSSLLEECPKCIAASCTPSFAHSQCFTSTTNFAFVSGMQRLSNR